jgi:hypothetical protein
MYNRCCQDGKTKILAQWTSTPRRPHGSISEGRRAGPSGNWGLCGLLRGSQKTVMQRVDISLQEEQKDELGSD